MSTFDGTAIHLQLLGLAIAFVGAAWILLRDHAPSLLLAAALLAVLTAPAFFGQLQTNSADVPLAMAIALGVAALAAWIRSGARGLLPAATLFLTAGAMTKNEGELFALCAFLAALAATPRVRLRRSGWNLADGADSFFPVTAVDEPTLALARALIADEGVDASIRRRVVDATDDLEHRLAVRRAFPTADGYVPRVTDRPRRPGPSVRTRVVELTRRGRAPPRGPAGHRGAAGDPAGLARRAGRAGPGSPCARPDTTSSSPPGGWCTRAWSPGRVHEVAYCTDADLAPEQEFNVVTVTLAAPPAATPATGTSRQSPAPRPAGSAARTASPRRSAVPRRRRAGPARCRRRTSYAACRTRCASASRSSTAPAACTRRASPPPTASCWSSARTSVGTTRWTR